MFACPSCGKWVRMDDSGRVPPWCSACGASLKSGKIQPKPEPETYTSSRAQVVETDIQVAGTVASRPANPGSTDIQAAGARPPLAACTDIQEGISVTPIAEEEVPIELPVDVPDISIGANQVHWNAKPVSIANSRKGVYRVYLTRTELFFILMEPDRESTKTMEAAGFVVGGIVGGLLTRMMLEDHAPSRTSSVADILRGADEETLRLYAQREPGCFYRELASCESIRLEKPSVWVRWVNGIEHEALLTLSRFGVKETWALLNYHDARKALHGLTDTVGDRLQVGLGWGVQTDV